MRHASLFSGIGGFDLAAEWMGWENVFHCEWNEFGQKVLKHYWPEAESFHDITKTDFTKYANRIDILTGGFPCQPYSMAGKRKGKEDERHLWPEMLRCIREVRPRWVVGENVFGFVNWSEGLVFHEVQSDLEAQGYEVFSYVLAAATINAPHRRDRIFIIAHSNDNGFNQCDCGDEIRSSERGFNALGNINEIFDEQPIIKHANSIRQKWRMYEDKSEVTIRQQSCKRNARSFESTTWENFPTKSPICDGDDGISDRLDSITFSKWRNESIKAGGNAVVPQLIYVLFKTIAKFEQLKSKQ
jgi:DNA (cytosine-5)-methyltransferase 1